MNVRAMVLTAGLATIAASAAGCSRHRQEAALLANQGDKEVALNPDGAITKYDEATKKDPTNHRIFFKLAMAYKKKEEWEKVSSTLARATQLAPKHANYWFERGWALENQAKRKNGSWADAIEPYQKCVETDPNFADCWAQLGNAYLFTNDEQKALENFTKAIDHNPHELRYYFNLADLYVRLGYMKEAEQVLKEAKSFAKPGDKALYGVHVLLASVYQDRGDMNAMVSELEAARTAAGNEGSEAVQILWNLGSTYAQLNPPRTQEAIQMLKGFTARACKGAKAATYKSECEQAQTLMVKLGGTPQ